MSNLKISSTDCSKIIRIAYAVAMFAVIMLGSTLLQAEYSYGPKIYWSLIGLLGVVAAKFVIKNYEKTHGHTYFRSHQNNINWLIVAFGASTALNIVVSLF